MRPVHDNSAGYAGADRITALRQAVAKVESAPLGAPRTYLSLGLSEVDRYLSGAGFACDALHEVAAATHGDKPAAFGFALALAALVLRECPGPAILVAANRCFADFGKPYGHGLAQLGLDARRLVLVETRHDKDALWAMEETLRSKAVAVVVGAIDGELNLTASRRLSLAAAASGTSLVLLRAPRMTGASAAVTRWRIGAAPADRDRFGAFASPRWNVALERCRNGRTGQWLLDWDHGAYRFRMAQGLADRAPIVGAGQIGLRLAG
jgi:protein ImuA